MGTPAAFIVFFAWALFPIALIISPLGPIKENPFSLQMLENSALSAKNPYPGWIASAFVISPAEIILGIFKYDFLLSGGPIQIASSANFTCSEYLSADE